MGGRGPHPCNAILTRGSDKKGNHGHLAIELRCPFRSAPVSGVIIDQRALCGSTLKSSASDDLTTGDFDALGGHPRRAIVKNRRDGGADVFG